MNRAIPYVVIVVLLAGAVGGYLLIQSGARHPSTGSASASNFSASDASLVISHAYLCGGVQGQCTPVPDVYVRAVISVTASSPLSCLDTEVNGTMEGEGCWNLTSPGFPHTECSGSGNATTCSTSYSANNNTETVRTFPMNQQVISYNGTNDGPVIKAGATYLITFVAHFEDGTSSTVSMVVVATEESDTSTTITVQTTTSAVK